MSNRFEIILSGVGGQGLVTGGTLLGEAAAIYEKLNATLTTSYGVETRGTFTKSDIIISDQDIFFPEVINANIILTLDQIAYDKYKNYENKDCVLVYDSDVIDIIDNENFKQYGYPISSTAKELGVTGSLNIIAIGVVVGLTKVTKPESIRKAIEDKFGNKQELIELNINAFNKGYEMSMQ